MLKPTWLITLSLQLVTLLYLALVGASAVVQPVNTWLTLANVGGAALLILRSGYRQSCAEFEIIEREESL